MEDLENWLPVDIVKYCQENNMLGDILAGKEYMRRKNRAFESDRGYVA